MKILLYNKFKRSKLVGRFNTYLALAKFVDMTIPEKKQKNYDIRTKR